MVVQAPYAHPALWAVLHVSSPVAPAPHTVALPVLLVFVFRDGAQVNDPGVHELGEEVTHIYENNHSQVDTDQSVSILCSDGVRPNVYPVNQEREDEQKDKIDEDEAGHAEVPLVIDQ